MRAVATAPTKFPIQTTTQLPRSATVATRRLAHAMTMRLLPVKSSAPATTTRMSPSVNVSPARSRTTP